MPKGERGRLAFIIKESTGMFAHEFADKVLNMKYGTFSHRVKKCLWDREHYLKILEATGKTWEELFGRGASGSFFPVPVQVVEQVTVAPPVDRPAKVKVEKVEKEREPESAPFVLDEIDLPLPGADLVKSDF